MPYAQADIYALINDIERYPEFLPYCEAARVVSTNDAEVVGELSLSTTGYHATLTTCNRLIPPSRIDLELLEGPVRNFSGCWQLTPLGNSGCKVELALQFDLVGSLKLAGFALRGRINKATDKVFAGFCARADAICTRAD